MDRGRTVKLVYWVADIHGDHPSYSIRGKTKREVSAIRSARGEAYYALPRKVEIFYEDAFDLVCQVLGEGNPEGFGRA